jgi:uncharacterized protein (DUF697 family)
LRRQKTRLNAGAVWGVLRELQKVAETQGPVAVGGAAEPAALLRRELSRGGAAAAVREGVVDGASVYVHVLAGAPSDADVEAFRRAHRAKAPIVAVAPRDADTPLPFVLATDVVRVETSAEPPIDVIARAIAGAVGEDATELAARLPVLRDAVCDNLIARFSRTNAIVGATFFVPGTDMPALTLNQLRLVLRIAAAYGVEVDRERLPEILAVVGSGFALRTVARQVLGVVPVAGWAVKGAVAYGGTRAVGEAARRYFADRARTPGASARAS